MAAKKTATRKPIAKQTAAKKATRKSAAKQPARKQPRMLAGGNPQIAKGDGDAPVEAYLDAIDGWRGDLARRLDALVVRTVPGVKKAVRWNSPFYGREGQGWFVAFHVFTRYLKVTFFKGTELQPQPPGGTGKEARWIDVHEHDLDAAQMARWIKQAAALPGWLSG